MFFTDQINCHFSKLSSFVFPPQRVNFAAGGGGATTAVIEVGGGATLGGSTVGIGLI